MFIIFILLERLYYFNVAYVKIEVLILDVMMPKIPPVSHTVLVHYKQHLHNEKKGPSREYRCGTGQTPSEGQVRIILTTLEC